MKILITGAGIAGLSSAFWLKHYGHDVTIVEKVQDYKAHYGYMIDFFGPGYEVLQRMGLAKEAEARHYSADKLFYVNKVGKKVSHLNVAKFRETIDQRAYMFLRGDLEDILHDAIASQITIRAGVTVTAFNETPEHINVSFSDNTESDFDLVIGADGIHSATRKYLFGDEAQFTKYLGYRVAAFIQPNTMNIHEFFSYSEPEKLVGVFPTKRGNLATYFIYKEANERASKDRQTIVNHFKDCGWIVPQLLESMQNASEVLIDSVTQIILPQWHKGRFALVGDACQCLTLVSGQGASMALTGGYLLAKELHEANNDYEKAFNSYQAKLKPDIEAKQIQAQKFMTQFVPNTAFGIQARNIVTWFLNYAPFMKMFFDKPYQISPKNLPGYLKD